MTGAACPALGCGDEPVKQEHRKQLLKPRNLAKEKAIMIEKSRLADAEGNLLPSDETVAGVVLPRGFRLALKTEKAWYFESRHSLPALHKFFGPRLFTGEIKRGGRGVVTFVKAIPKDNPTSKRVDVRIGPLASDASKTEVMIRLAQPKVVKRMSFRESRKQLEAAQKYAD